MSASDPASVSAAPVTPGSTGPDTAGPAPGPAWKRWLPVAMPVVSLGLGILSQAMSRHTVTFAPKAVLILVVAWTLAGGIGEWLPEAREGEPRARLRNLLRTAASTITVSLFRNVLFFLVPVWFASATLSSINVLAPLTLAAMGLLSCFPAFFRARVLERPRLRTVWCSGVLFAALVPAAAVEISASPRLSAAIAAAVAWIVASILTGRVALNRRRGREELVVSAVLAAVLCASIAPLLPPVPVACRAAAAGTTLKDRELEGEARRFPVGTKRVYAWFAVYVPRHYRQGIKFDWYRDGRAVAHTTAREVVGGREQGYRTAAYTSSPAAGSWRVDLRTDAGQLIARTRFRVE